MKKLVTLYLVLFSFTNLKAQNSDINRLNAEIKIAVNDTLRIYAYRNYVNYYIALNPDSARYYLEKAKEIAIKLNHPKFLGQVYSSEGKLFEARNLHSEAKSSELKALDLFYLANFKSGIAVTYNALGVIEGKSANYRQAANYFLRSLKINEEINNIPGLIQTCSSLGNLNLKISKFKKSYYYFKKALDLVDDTLSSSYLNLMNSFGTLYGMQGKLDSALYYTNKGLNACKGEKLGSMKIPYKTTLLMNAAIIYANWNELPKANFYYQEALNLSRKYKLPEEEARVLYNIALLNEHGNPKLALANYDSSLTISLKIGQKHLISENYYSKYLLLKNLGFYKDAINALENFHLYKDSVLSLDNKNSIELMQTNFDLEKSKVAVKELEIKNQKQKSIQIISLLLMIGTALTLSIVAYNSRRRRILNKSLQDSIKVRDKLLSIITHDLKSPIHNILTLLNELNDSNLNETDQKFLMDSLLKQTQLSSDTLDNILKWGQGQIRGTKVNTSNFDLNGIIGKNVELLQFNLKSKNLHIDLKLDSKLMVRADDDQVDFVIRNVLSNAIKFSNLHSSILINSDTSDAEYIKLSIVDQGVGMTEDVRSTLFGTNPKVQYGTAMERGSGLGLILSKEFIEANGGEIKIESELGKGTIVNIKLRKSDS